MTRTRWKEDLKDLPALALSDLASDPLRLLLVGMAAAEGLPFQQWMDLRLRSMAVMALPNAARTAVLSGHQGNAWGKPKRPVDYVALSAPSEPADVPDDASLWAGVDVMAEDIKDAVEDIRLARKTCPVASGRHRLWQAPTQDRSKSFAANDGRQFWLKQLAAMGPDRDIVRVTAQLIRRVEHLLVDAPNVREATLFVLGQLALAHRNRGELRLPPLLLVGPPAAGKTWWSQQLADALGVRCEFIALPSVTATFELSGGSAQWHAGTPGRIARTFLETKQASPVFVLDEIDKAISNNGYPVAPTLLGLVDRCTSARWRDEFFDLEFDVSKSVFIATANYPDRIDPALRSRFRRIDVRGPNRAERSSLVVSIWRHFRKSRTDLRLPASLSFDVVAVLVEQFQDARQILRLFDEGLGRAARRRGRLRLLPSDVGGPAVRPCPTSAPQP